MITKLELLNFKKHAKKEIKLDNKITLIYGPNGSGKTTILEALSLFTVGKGIFNLQNDSLISQGKDYFCLQINSKHSFFKIQYRNKKKQVLINNSRSLPSNLLEHISILGLTPYTSLAFWQDNSLKRKIINRIMLQHCPAYAKHYNQYETALKHRNLIISHGNFNNKWKEVLDPIIIENGLKINEIRKSVFSKLFNNISYEIKNFLQEEINLIIDPSFEKQEEIFKNPLGESFIGPHISKFWLKTSVSLPLSTGEQRKLLLSLLLISLNINKNKNNLLLLDDVITNLDEKNIFELLNLLNSQNIQTIITHISKINHPALKTIEIY